MKRIKSTKTYIAAFIFSIMLTHHICYNMELPFPDDDVEMTPVNQKQQTHQSPQGLTFLGLPDDVYYEIASHLRWQDIRNTSLACSALNNRFNDPTRPIVIDYSKVRKLGVIGPFFNSVFTQLQAIRENPKLRRNPISLLLRTNRLAEAPAYRCFGAFLRKLAQTNQADESISSQIRMMDLSFNRLTKIPDSAAPYIFLRELAFFGNKPEAIAQAPEQFPALQKLGLTVYPDTPHLELAKWQHLQKLYLNLQFLGHHPSPPFPSIAALINLKKLYFQGNSEPSIFNLFLGFDIWRMRPRLDHDYAEQICGLPKLESLTLQNVDLPLSLGSQLAHAQNLRKLRLIAVNHLSEPSIERTSADPLMVAINNQGEIEPADETTRIINPEQRLDSLLHEIHQLHHLHTLDLSCNRLRHLPVSIALLDGLKRLILHENNLETLPPELASLTNLENLNVAIRPESVETAPDLAFNPEQLTSLPHLCRLYILAVRPKTNDLPLLRQLVRIRQQLLANTAGLQEIGTGLHELNSEPTLCRESKRRAQLISMILHLLEPTITRSLLARARHTIEDLSQRDEHPILALQRTLWRAFELKEESTTNRPQKRRRTMVLT